MLNVGEIDPRAAYLIKLVPFFFRGSVVSRGRGVTTSALLNLARSRGRGTTPVLTRGGTSSARGSPTMRGAPASRGSPQMTSSIRGSALGTRGKVNVSPAVITRTLPVAANPTRPGRYFYQIVSFV